MDSYMEAQFQTQHQNSGLLRFRSAPSSVFNDFTQNLGVEFSESSYESKPQRLNLNSVNGYSGSCQLPPQYPKQTMVSSVSNSTCSIQRSSSLDVNQSTVQENGSGLNLNRQSSSPAGFFNQLNPQNGYTIMRGLGNFRVGNGANGESSPRTSRLAMSSHLPQIPEIGNEIKETTPEELQFRHHEDDASFDSPAGFSFVSWNESGSETSNPTENGGHPSRSNVLTHHLSLPKTSAEMAAVDKLLHFRDMVPCKVRAKRGCATHPRSIAERERRNRISDRMRKLQDLVPNMDKQTNTADMLDLAVDYIKELQNHFKVLSENRAKCKCVNLQGSMTHQGS